MPRLAHVSVPDVEFVNHGSIMLARLNTLAAEEWVAENVGDDALFFGSSLVVEPRYAEALRDGMQSDGLNAR